MQHVERLVGGEKTPLVSARRIAMVVGAALAVMAAVPPRASAMSQVPFEATLAERVTGAAPCPADQTRFVCISVTGSGQATHLGAINESMVVVVDNSSTNPATDCQSEFRTSTLTAANGDQITLAGPGLHCALGAPQETGLDSWEVTAGTGRFAGASGTGTDSASIDAASTPVTSVTTFRGTISSPGSPR
jgi:hypothetical protein